MKGSIYINWGNYGGFYIFRGKTNTRFCFGWIAVTYFPLDMDDTIREANRILYSRKQKNMDYD